MPPSPRDSKGRRFGAVLPARAKRNRWFEGTKHTGGTRPAKGSLQYDS